jgi:hypothetical protein
MNAIDNDFWHEQADEPVVRIDEKRIDPRAHDAYWQSVHWAQPHHRDELDYEDYAPAYCVGYVGFAQYGGSYDDAEKSLCANWVRIKGASRLSLDDAMSAIRAAWHHAARSHARREEPEEERQQFETAELATA